MWEGCAQFGVEVLVWCLMTNHVHFVMIPSEQDSLARAVGSAHKRFTRKRNFEEGVRGYLFQGRFHSCVLDERHVLAAGRYVLMNPVRAGIVKTPEEWKWSSGRYHLELQETDQLVRDGSLMGLVENWRDFLDDADNVAEEEVSKNTRTGRPAGSNEFVGRMEALTGRTLRRGRPGPKTNSKN
jgi:Transposase and inactivated derivatives